MKFIKIKSFFISFLTAIALSAQADQSSRLNINTATAEEIDKVLVFVGSQTAEAIVLHRSERGGFESLDDFAQVEGVSKRLARYNRSRIRFE